MAWEARRAALQALVTWTLAGRIAVSTPDDGWNAALRWRRGTRGYQVDLSGPFGQGTVQLRGGPQGVVMRTREGVQTAPDAETLLGRRFGWQMPLGSLSFWVRGLPGPGAVTEFRLDDQGRVRRLRQDGWDVDFPAYTRVNGLELPRMILLTHGALRVRLAIHHWQVNGGAHSG